MTTPQLFGTDGIRAHSSSAILSPDQLVCLARIFAKRIKEGFFGPSAYASVVIGKDTRASGLYLEQALLAGFLSAGVDCHVLGVLPTAGVPHFTREMGAALGVMVSASHNPHYDNGLKLFDPFGFKITESQERELEQDYFGYHELAYAVCEKPGALHIVEDAGRRYSDMVMRAFVSVDLSGLHIALDCAYGAASQLAQHIIEQSGARVSAVGEFAPGKAINLHCGSEAPEKIKSDVVRTRADIGIAFDGDADRVIFVDEHGVSIEGDAILAAIAIDLKADGLLAHDTVVATIMSSIALDNALTPHGIRVVRTSVGDKLVARKMLEDGLSFGGENSGHLIMFPHSTTGDGVLSALKFLSILKKTGRPVSELVSFFKPTPKILKNFSITEKVALNQLPKTMQAIDAMNATLKEQGRVMLRYSGTENKARLLVEASSETECERIVRDIGDEFLAELALHTRAA